ncbi:hypothetical protein HYX14_03530 [Candidatus Woesearchaeota archaeon]|nr:hypothetical protein [Candidatus Woesearchaeota archaeon]
MPERTLVIDHVKFSYEGLFNAAELYNLISSFFYERGWDWYEKLNEEQVTAEGRQIRIVLEPWKNISDYYKIQAKIKLTMSDVKEVDVEHEGQKLRLNHGVIHIIFDAYVISDRKSKWQDKPFWWFLSVVGDKYFFREHYQKAERFIKSDVEQLYDKIKTYLNVFKYTYQA